MSRYLPIESESTEDVLERLVFAQIALAEHPPNRALATALIGEALVTLEGADRLVINQNGGMLKFNEVIERLDMSTVPEGLYEDFIEWREMTPAERISAGREADTPIEFRQPLDFDEVQDWIDLMTVPNHITW